jgi:hypothetical protein
MDVISNDRQSTLHGLSAQIQMSLKLVCGGRRHSHKTGESMTIDDHLDQMFELV